MKFGFFEKIDGFCSKKYVNFFKIVEGGKSVAEWILNDTIS